MNFRFRLTAAFTVFAVAIFAVAFVLVSRSASGNEEANLVADISKQTDQDAELVSGVASSYTADDSLHGASSDAPASINFQTVVLGTLTQSSNVVNLALYDASGSLIWSSSEDSSVGAPPTNSDAFSQALKGESATALNRDVQFVSTDGEFTQGDLTATYIPLGDVSGGSSLQVLEVSREVTDVLNFRVGNARDSMFRTLFTTLGASFIVLLGVVITADTMLHRSKARAVAHELAMAESKVEAEKLELHNQQLQQLNEERDKFLSMVSHELRTPLTSMLAFTEVIRKRVNSGKGDRTMDHLDLMRRNGDHLNSLIEELLEVTKLHGDQFEIVKEKFSLSKLMAEIELSAEPLIRSRKQTLRIEGDFSDAELYADRKRVSQMIMNLISNASLYSPERTMVTVKVDKRGELVKIEVIDEGVGISEEDSKRLFDEFFRGNNEQTRAQSGLGLGLPIVKAVLDAHDGKVSVKSKPNEGTQVTVLLPVGDQDAIENEGALAA